MNTNQVFTIFTIITLFPFWRRKKVNIYILVRPLPHGMESTRFAIQVAARLPPGIFTLPPRRFLPLLLLQLCMARDMS
jgi:hypothetical protein